MTKSIRQRKGERGSVLAYTVLSVLFLFFAVGLGVDLSHLYLAKTELQNTADASALAAASALKDPGPARITTAVDRAISVMNNNKYNFDNRNYVDVMSLAAQRALVRFAVNLSEFDTGNGVSEAEAFANPDDIRFVRVTTPTVPISIFFSVPILGVSQGLNARAVSGLSVAGNLSVCIAPLSAVSCTPGDVNCSLCDPGDPLYPNCTWSKYWGNCGGSDPHGIQTVPVKGPDDPDGDGQCDPKREFCKRCTYNIRSEGQNQQGPMAGNFQILRCAGNGADAVRQALAAYATNCDCGRVSPQDEVETQTGVVAGAVRQGLNVRFDVYEGGLSYGLTMPPDSNIEQGISTGSGSNEVWPGITYQQYQGESNPVIPPTAPANGHTGIANRRVLVIPIIPMSEFTDETGNQTVRIGSLAGFFMRAQVSGGTGGDIQVEYIADDIIGVIGYDPNDNNITNIVTPVLYR